ncbi:MAG: hypothetical protein GX222_05405 [Ruminococcaceae bacterium]|nr:hypothetical protein [Oscillospiraceae bacterium]
MNYFSTGTAIVLTLIAAAMWGSWMQVVKLTKGYPISGIVFWLYTLSFFMIWGVTFALSGLLLPEGIIAASSGEGRLILEILLGGGLMSLGLYFSLHVMGEIGLLLSTAISGAIIMILGLLTSIMKEGLPDKDGALTLIILSTVVFLAASFLCNYAAQLRDRDRAKADGIDPSTLKKGGPLTLKVIFLLFLNAFLTNGWSLGTAAGTAAKFPPILTCAYMATGSFISIFVFCGIIFTVKKQWKTILCVGSSKRPILLGGVSAFCHYGGNLISIYSMPVISATISFLLGRTSTVWTYFWGLAYKEFSGSKKKTIAVLVSGLALFFVGVGLVGLFYFG